MFKLVAARDCCHDRHRAAKQKIANTHSNDFFPIMCLCAYGWIWYIVLVRCYKLQRKSQWRKCSNTKVWLFLWAWSVLISSIYSLEKQAGMEVNAEDCDYSILNEARASQLVQHLARWGPDKPVQITLQARQTCVA